MPPDGFFLSGGWGKVKLFSQNVFVRCSLSQGARNIYTKEDIYREFLEKPKRSLTGKKTILIFHCEFSSKRGPDM